MLIKIKTAVPMPEIPSEVELDAGRLRDLFIKLFENTHFAREIIDPKTGDILWDGILNISVNSVPYQNLAQGLDSALRDGDTVAFSLIMLGGG